MKSQLKTDPLYSDIKMLIEQSRQRTYQAINFEMVQTYWQIGQRIVEEEQVGNVRAGYGDALIETLADKLVSEFGKGFNKRNLFYMRRFYLDFPIVNALRSLLSWTHYRLITQIEDEAAKIFYMNEAADNHWSTRQLERQIQTQYYHRMISVKSKEKKDGAVVSKESGLNPADFIKDPYVLEFLDIKPYLPFHEQELERAILDKIQEFLLELGKGFCFVARQRQIATEQNSRYRIDLVFYNYLLRCFVLIDLKIGVLSAEDVGKMDMYVRMYEDQFKPKDDNPTLGIILCSKSDKTVVKYSILNDSKQLFASQYQMVIPAKEEFARVVNNEIQLINNENSLMEKYLPYGNKN